MQTPKNKDEALMLLATHPHQHFSRIICEKFPNQWTRWIRCSQNARWMLRNNPTSALSNNQRMELLSVAIGNPEEIAIKSGLRK